MEKIPAPALIHSWLNRLSLFPLSHTFRSISVELCCHHPCSPLAQPWFILQKHIAGLLPLHQSSFPKITAAQPGLDIKLIAGLWFIVFYPPSSLSLSVTVIIWGTWHKGWSNTMCLMWAGSQHVLCGLTVLLAERIPQLRHMPAVSYSSAPPPLPCYSSHSGFHAQPKLIKTLLSL